MFVYFDTVAILAQGTFWLLLFCRPFHWQGGVKRNADWPLAGWGTTFCAELHGTLMAPQTAAAPFTRERGSFCKTPGRPWGDPGATLGRPWKPIRANPRQSGGDHRASLELAPLKRRRGDPGASPQRLRVDFEVTPGRLGTTPGNRGEAVCLAWRPLRAASCLNEILHIIAYVRAL